MKSGRHLQEVIGARVQADRRSCVNRQHEQPGPDVHKHVCVCLEGLTRTI